MTNGKLRAALTATRRKVPPRIAGQAARSAAHLAWQMTVFQRARRIAAYLAVNGELDCATLIEIAWARGREVYLPVLNGSALRFSRYRPDTALEMNRFAIPEPAGEHLLQASALDVVIAPLVAFDRSGNRLGMGGGFYDRSFSFRRHRKLWRHPRLIGFAYEMQGVDSLAAQAWDVPLDAVVTESSKYEFPRK